MFLRGRMIAQCWVNVRTLVARRGLGTNVRPCAPSKGVNDHPRMGERSLPQCV
jgi:hypothetical protein